jgi:LuxR family quorum sensing-dependent transcriptional regulator
MMLNGWPSGWTELYTRENLVQNDPVVAHCFRSNAPFEWTDAPYDATTNPRAKDVIDRATDFRMNRGFCVPIHGSEGFQAVVTMAGDAVDLEGPTKRALHVMSLYAFGKAAELWGRPCAQPKILTKREREVLQWTSVGKTAWEVSQILNISEQTVVTHLKAAAIKFDTPNRTATVVASLRRGEISL